MEFKFWWMSQVTEKNVTLQYKFLFYKFILIQDIHWISNICVRHWFRSLEYNDQ